MPAMAGVMVGSGIVQGATSVGKYTANQVKKGLKSKGIELSLDEASNEPADAMYSISSSQG